MKKQVATQSHVSAQRTKYTEISFSAFNPVKVHNLTSTNIRLRLIILFASK